VADRAVPVLQNALAIRVASAIVLAVPTIAAIVWGRPALEAWLAVAIVLMAREWHTLCGGGGWTASRFALLGLALAALVLAAANRYPAAVALALVGVPILVAVMRRERGLQPWFAAAGLPYIALAALALSWMRAVPEVGLLNVLWLFGVVWTTDIAAFFVGRSLGGPKLAPRISPGKTWSGAVGGGLGAAFAGAGLALAAGADPLLAAAVSLPLSAVAQAGDLAESAVKRHFGVKDSGSIIPGHGGLFDRVDAVLAAAPVAALTLYLVGADALWR
jgi:phosphatidate cytidylyltransferase